MARSNYTPEQLLATKPTDIRNIPACTAWFADVERWADIERAEGIKTDAWRALNDITELCSRQDAVDIIVGKLEAYIKIVLVETPTPFDPAPKVPDIDEATHDFNPTNPDNDTKDAEPSLPTKTPLNESNKEK